MDDRALLKVAVSNIKADYQSGKISRIQYHKEMTYWWNYRRQLNEQTTKE